MDTSHEAVDQIIRISLQTGEVVLRLAGAGAKELLALIMAAFKKQNGKPPKMTAGKRRLLNLLQACRAEGSRIERYPLKPEDSKEFKRLCKQHGVLYAAIRDRKNNDITVIARESDALMLNLIYEKLGYGKPEKDPAQSVEVSEADPATLDVPEPKKNKASEQPSFRRGNGLNQSKLQTGETATNIERDSSPAFFRRGPDLTKSQVIDVEFYEVPKLPPPPGRLGLPAPENYIGVNKPAPSVIISGEPDGRAERKTRKPSIRERVYTIRADMAKNRKPQTPIKAKVKPKVR